MLVSMLVIPAMAQQSTKGKVGTVSPTGMVQSAKLTSTIPSVKQLFVHEYNSNQNLVYNLPELDNYYKLASVTSYINTGDFADDNYLYGTGLFWDNNLYRIDVNTGNSVSVGTFSLGYEMSVGMAFSKAFGKMYMMTVGYTGGSRLYEVNLSDASVNLLATYSTSEFATLAFDEKTNLFYTIDDNSDKLFRISPTGWGATAVGPVGFDLDYYFSGADFDDNSGKYYVSQYNGTDACIYQVSPATGLSTKLTTVGYADFIVVAVKENIVPVPVSIWIVISVFALIAIGFVVRRRFF